MFGVSLTSAEAEGVAESADWSAWIKQDKAPDSKDGAAFRDRSGEYLAQMAEQGADEICLTAEWARLEPTKGHYDQAEIELRRQFLEEASNRGMKPWLCLVDGTLPGWFSYDDGGFADPENLKRTWPHHVEWIGETFGDLVAGWVSIREPAMLALKGHRYAAAPPGFASVDKNEKALAGTIKASLAAIEVLAESAPIAVWQTGRLISGEKDNVKARPIAEWLDESLWASWNRLADEPGSWDRLIVTLRPSVIVDSSGGWSPAPVERQVDDFADVAYRSAELAEGRDLVLASDFSSETDGSDRLELVKEIGAEVNALGLWSTRPIGGWNWENGFYQYSS